MIEAVESNSEGIHEKTKLKEQADPDRMVANEESKSNKKVL